jgi:hypothetical protein
MNLIMSRHAKEQARERGISIYEIKNCIQRGAKSLQGKKIIAMYMHIKVVYKKIGDCNFVITAMIRGEKNGK